MKKNKKIVILMGIIILVTVAVASVIIIKKTRHMEFPEGFYFASGQYSASEDGLYFTRNLYGLDFYDREIGTEVPVCNKPNCEHYSLTCNAYLGGVMDIMVYGDYVYVSTYERDYTSEKWSSSIVQISRDGQEKNIIFETDSYKGGLIRSFAALKGKIYYTYYIDVSTEISDGNLTPVEKHDVYFGCYDIEKDKNKTIKSWEDVIDGEVFICRSNSEDNIYLHLKYMSENVDYSGLDSEDYETQVEVSKKITDAEYGEIYVYDIETDSISRGWDNLNKIDYYPKVYNDNLYYTKMEWDRYVITPTDGPGAVITVDDYLYMDEDSVERGYFNETVERIHIRYPYVLFFTGEYDKILYDVRTKKCYYQADINEKTPFILTCDVENEIVYVDYSCYDNIAEGTLITSDPAKIVPMSMDEYVETFYVDSKDDYEGTIDLDEEWLNEVNTK